MAKEDKKGGRPRVNIEPNLVKQEKLRAIASLYELDELDKKLLKINNKFPDAPPQHYAEYLNVDLVCILERMEKPVYKAAWKDYNSSHQDLFNQSLKKAIRVCMQLMDSADDNIRLKACDSVFKALKTDVNLTQVNVQNNTQRVFRSTIQEDGTLLGMVMDEELNKGVINATVETVTEVSKKVE